ncbi:NAC domain containing protein 100 [Striga asiatica]|uniref:NAC domain containing protein 100 n=1 Tax=Striga asiatica TaxID=4170 RepID=A0A5A7P3R7_STRAF|nr:NAC domain containing protein 100 [Striga asiatica]
MCGCLLPIEKKTGVDFSRKSKAGILRAKGYDWLDFGRFLAFLRATAGSSKPFWKNMPAKKGLGKIVHGIRGTQTEGRPVEPGGQKTNGVHHVSIEHGLQVDNLIVQCRMIEDRGRR